MGLAVTRSKYHDNITLRKLKSFEMGFIVFIPKCRKKELYGKIRKYLGSLSHELAAQRNCKILEGHMVPDHVHMLISIPPKYSVAG